MQPSKRAKHTRQEHGAACILAPALQAIAKESNFLEAQQVPERGTRKRDLPAEEASYQCTAVSCPPVKVPASAPQPLITHSEQLAASNRQPVADPAALPATLKPASSRSPTPPPAPTTHQGSMAVRPGREAFQQQQASGLAFSAPHPAPPAPLAASDGEGHHSDPFPLPPHSTLSPSPFLLAAVDLPPRAPSVHGSCALPPSPLGPAPPPSSSAQHAHHNPQDMSLSQFLQAASPLLYGERGSSSATPEEEGALEAVVAAAITLLLSVQKKVDEVDTASAGVAAELAGVRESVAKLASVVGKLSRNWQATVNRHEAQLRTLWDLQRVKESQHLPPPQQQLMLGPWLSGGSSSLESLGGSGSQALLGGDPHPGGGLPPLPTQVSLARALQEEQVRCARLEARLASVEQRLR